jgi:thiopurine S-methyltransferase
MTFGVKLRGELHYTDAATATAAHAAMMEGRTGNWMLASGARLDGAVIRFSFDNALPVFQAPEWIDSTEFGIEKALVTASTGEVVYTDETGFTRSMKALSRPFWQDRWGKHQTGFHEGKPNDLLLAHFPRIERPGMRILVPLAGKANDLIWLASRGHEVVGVEFVIQAIGEFFEAQEVDHWQHHQKLGPHDAFTVNGVTMICDDFFNVKPEVVGRFDAIYDRAALIALEPSTRTRYVETCLALLAEAAPTFLIGLSYDQEKTVGPPWSVDETCVRELFAGRSIELLQSRTTKATPRLAEAGLEALEETAYLIR